MRKRFKRRLIIVILLIIGIAVLSFTIYSSMVYAPNNNQNPTSEKAPEKNDQQEAKQTFPFIDLQPIVDKWADKQSGTASVIIYDLSNNKTAAELDADKQYFAASLYKLYVTYFGYQAVSDGTYSLNDKYLGEWSRGKCLDEMIRSSYSPCAEKMWIELGKDNLTDKLKAININNTSMTGLTTTARDAADLLKRLYERQGITNSNALLYLSSMKDQDQKFRRGLPAGFSKATVYNKVGWNELVEWHDTAIVTMPSGRSYIICVLTKSVGYANIAALGKSIENKLLGI